MSEKFPLYDNDKKGRELKKLHKEHKSARITKIVHGTIAAVAFAGPVINHEHIDPIVAELDGAVGLGFAVSAAAKRKQQKEILQQANELRRGSDGSYHGDIVIHRK